ncbi:hypothetical protein [Primorskyibacter sp. S187A]|uniref:hypothetical protein n=1 Tax=Primorskyibacter sp. S187A TaxID=3415130 RepID=UPI003C7D5B49
MLRFIQLLLPVLFPSWRFFREVGPGISVQRRIGQGDGQGDWADVIARPEHVSPALMAVRLVWNPRVNQRLYLVSLAERLLTEPTAYVEAELHARVAHGLPPGTAYALRILLCDADGEAVAHQSAVRRLGSGSP